MLDIKCLKKRTIFDLFTIYKCDGCEHYKKDETIIIGKQSINVYYLFNDCLSLGINKDELVYNSKKLKILLKEAILYNESIIFLIVEDFKMDAFFEVFERILDNDLDIHIVSI